MKSPHHPIKFPPPVGAATNVLTMCGYLTKFVVVEPIKTKSADEVQHTPSLESLVTSERQKNNFRSDH